MCLAGFWAGVVTLQNIIAKRAVSTQQSALSPAAAIRYQQIAKKMLKNEISKSKGLTGRNLERISKESRRISEISPRLISEISSAARDSLRLSPPTHVKNTVIPTSCDFARGYPRAIPTSCGRTQKLIPENFRGYPRRGRGYPHWSCAPCLMHPVCFALWHAIPATHGISAE